MNKQSCNCIRSRSTNFSLAVKPLKASWKAGQIQFFRINHHCWPGGTDRFGCCESHSERSNASTQTCRRQKKRRKEKEKLEEESNVVQALPSTFPQREKSSVSRRSRKTESTRERWRQRSLLRRSILNPQEKTVSSWSFYRRWWKIITAFVSPSVMVVWMLFVVWWKRKGNELHTSKRSIGWLNGKLTICTNSFGVASHAGYYFSQHRLPVASQFGRHDTFGQPQRQLPLSVDHLYK